MARTSPRKWTLRAALAAMLASFGEGEFPSPTYRSLAKRWRCPVCMRVEKFEPRRTPRCSGTPENQHPIRATQPVLMYERVRLSDGHYFF
jgi:hypothetical protein